MKNSKFLRSALIFALCLAILGGVTGGTIAWFTDTEESTNNVIKAGNLDMVVSYKPYGAENTTWTVVDENTKIFDETALYEPGYTEAIWLKVENVGNLAFRANAALQIVSEKAGVNQAGESFELSDYLTVKAAAITDVEGWEAFYTTRKSLENFAFPAPITLSSPDLTFAQNLALIPDVHEATYVLVVVEMPTTVGNEANHNGTDVPEIVLGLTAVATQLPHEEDSFDNQYDAEATFPEVDLTNAPEAKMEDIAASDLPKDVAVYKIWPSFGTTSEVVAVDKGYVFTALQSAEEAATHQYADWHADFVVTVNDDMAANTCGLAGQYDSWSSDWLAFHLPKDAVAGESFRLLNDVAHGIKYNYVELCEIVKVFRAGVYNLADENVGKSITVELRLYEPVAEDIPLTNTDNEGETGNFVTLLTENYTLGPVQESNK